jgi:hypothetical protein
MKRLFLITIVAMGASSMHLVKQIESGKAAGQPTQPTNLQSEIQRMDSVFSGGRSGRRAAGTRIWLSCFD